MITMSINPMRSTGMTGQSSNRGTCVIPKTYLRSSSRLLVNLYHTKQLHIQRQTIDIDMGKPREKELHRPKNNISFFQRPVLLNPCGQSFTDTWILVWKLSSRKHLILGIWCNPKVMFQECCSSQKLGLRTG